MFSLVASAILLCAAAPQTLSAAIEGDTVVVRVGDAVVTKYLVSDTQKYPYFYPVNGPVSGRSITTETSEPYPHHHSLFFGCDRVNGWNFWQEGLERGQIVSQGQVVEQGEGDRVVFTDTCLWRVPDQEPLVRDTRRIEVSAPDETTHVIDFAITIEPLVDITVEKTNHSLFSARVVPELSVSQGGTLVNAEGATGEAGTFGIASPWCDYSGTRDGITEGIAIVQHPGNPDAPWPWFTRDYGFFSPTPLPWIEEPVRLAKGDPLTLRFRVIVHEGGASALRGGCKGLLPE